MKRIQELSPLIEQSAKTDNIQEMSLIDLHLHTFYSDGTLSPAEVVKRAAERGVKTIAVTDHDGLFGVAEAMKAGEKVGVTVLPGIEFSAGLSTIEIELFESQAAGKDVFAHILGYGIDIGENKINAEIMRIREMREIRNAALLNALNSIGCELLPQDLLFREGQDYVGKPNFAVALKKRGYISELKDAFAEGMFLRHPEVRKVHREKVEAKDAIELILGAGGDAVLAHPLKIGGFKGGPGYFDRLEALLEKLQEYGLSGMECRYSSHTAAQTERLISIAKKRGLAITAGSDFHGPEFDKSLDIGIVGCRSKE
ncbi:MAG: PHP domain-containing protein [Eubacteriales bacterium]|nr:PHP domain-containing protein [Eubacteriales bacterium]MDD3349713.1 PHP domain-containing protein [Eubacteriales bacterium]